MSRPHDTLVLESISFDVSVADLISADAEMAAVLDTPPAGPDDPLELLLRLDSPRAELGEGEDGGGSHSPPKELDTDSGEDGGGSHTPPEKDTGTGEDGGGSHTPPRDEPPSDAIADPDDRYT